MKGIAITTAAVALGGGLGAMIRSASECAGAALGIANWGVVLIINVLGCVAMGFLFFWLESRLRRDGKGRLQYLHVRHALRGTRGIFEMDLTLPAPELARFQRQLALKSGFLLTGVLGGLTTFSSFALDVVKLAEDGQTGMAILDIVLSLVLGIGGIILGLEIGRRTSTGHTIQS